MACTILFIVFLLIIITFLKSPFSRTKASFLNDIHNYSMKFGINTELFSEQDLNYLPEPVSNHLKISGYVGKSKMCIMKAYICSAPLKDSIKKPPMIVDYTLFSFANEPIRLAYIRTSFFGIPFEAYDSTQNGVGFMKGVVAKIITLFNQTGYEMDKGQLLTYLAECFLIPSCILSNYITWEAIDNTHVKASITYKNISGSGIFTFGDDGFVKSFHTDERAKIGTDGNIDHPDWSLVYESFKEKDGIFYPAGIKTIWHDLDGDLVYFDADNIYITYDNDSC